MYYYNLGRLETRRIFFRRGQKKKVPNAEIMLDFNGLRCPQEGEINSFPWPETTPTAIKR